MNMPEKRCMVLCTVTEVKDSQVVYPCCPKCCSKLRSDCFHDRWQCLKCGYNTIAGEMDWRYRLSLLITDGPVLVNICVFGSVLQQYFGLPPNQFVRFLRKVESTYGNSEDVVLQALRQCFVGNYYYFGLKASTLVTKDNARVSLSQVITQKRTACQNALLTQEDTSSTVVFQMIPAVDREAFTLYEIIQNFFKVPSNVTLKTDHMDKQNISDSSFMWRSKNLDNSENSSRSTINGSSSFISLGQTTALLSCDMSDIDTSTTCLTKSSVYDKTKNSVCYITGDERIDKTTNNINNYTLENCHKTNKSGSFSMFFANNAIGFTKKLQSGFETEKGASVLRIDSEPLFSQHETVASRDSRPETSPVGRSIEKNRIQLCVNSESLFSQDNYPTSPEILRENQSQDSFICKQMESVCDATCSVMDQTKDMDNLDNTSLNGSLLLEKLKLPAMPGNVPDSEELELYLLNDSSFDRTADCMNTQDDTYTSEYQNTDTNTHIRMTGVGSSKENLCLNEDRDPVIIKQFCSKDPDSGQLNKKMDLSCDSKNEMDVQVSKSSKLKYDNMLMELECGDMKVEKYEQFYQPEEQNIIHKEYFIDNNDEVITCAPELGNSDLDELCCQFNENLKNYINGKDDDKLSYKNDANQESISDNKPIVYIDLPVNHIQASDHSKENAEPDNTNAIISLNLNAESQSVKNLSSRSCSIVSESQCLNCSEDLFGNSVEESKQTNNVYDESCGNSHFSLDEKISDCKKKSVRFSRRLSFQKSVQLIDLQMKMKSNNCNVRTDAELNKKSCLKSELQVIEENQQSTEQKLKDSHTLTGMVNSPIYNHNSMVLSQDLFSPSPDICLKFKNHTVYRNQMINKEKDITGNNSFSQHRHSSTPIDVDTDQVTEDINSDSLIFNDSVDIGDDKESFSPHNHLSSHCSVGENSGSLFSMSCSLFSNSYTKGNNSSCFSNRSNLKKESVLSSVSRTNYSCDLFSPSFCDKDLSPQIHLPVKRLFLDKQ